MYMWCNQILRSKAKEPLKVLSSSGIRGTKIYICLLSSSILVSFVWKAVHFKFWSYGGVTICGPNRSEKDRHLCRWNERIRRTPSQNAAFFTKSEHKTVALSSQFPRSTLGAPGFLHCCFPVFHNINLRSPGSFGMLLSHCSDKVSRCKQPQQPR